MCASDVIGGHAQALVVHQAEQMLRRRVALLGGAAIPVDRHPVILRHAAPVLVHEPEIALRSRIASFGRGPDPLAPLR